MKPFIKWAGGKRQILSHIVDFIDESKEDGVDFTYFEPFLGGGAVFFNLKPRKAVINDLNEDLINAYRVIQSDKYLELIEKLENHAIAYREDPDGHYYSVRELDRDSEKRPLKYSDVERAARMIFLNKTCYNGLYRVNSKGQFNTPMGRYHNPLICDKDNITEIHEYLSNPDNNIVIMSGSYEKCIELAKDNDIIYIDPPYDYTDDDGFTKYQMSGFSFEDFKKLKEECDKTLSRNAFVIISNNATDRVINLFQQDAKYQIFYDENKLRTLRNINCKGGERKTGYEVIFWGMNNNIPFPQANDLSKVIKLAMSDEDVLKDKEKAMQVLDVSTQRQVAYYLAALSYFKMIKSDKTFTDEFKNIHLNRAKVNEWIYKHLMDDRLFRNIYSEFENMDDIKVDYIVGKIKESMKDLSENTLKRRASTIKNWVKWLYNVDNNPFLYF